MKDVELLTHKDVAEIVFALKSRHGLMLDLGMSAAAEFCANLVLRIQAGELALVRGSTR